MGVLDTAVANDKEGPMTKKQIPITDTDDLSRTLRESVAHANSLLGEILLADGEITPEQLQETLDAQKASEPKKHLGELLVELGFSSQEQVNIALADKLGVPYVSLEDFAVEQFPVSLIDGVSLANKGGGFEVLGNEAILALGEGKTSGLEFLFQQKLAKNFYGILAYTYFSSEFSGLDGVLVRKRRLSVFPNIDLPFPYPK